jgi:photosystem II stability/assembly factor-like uncharacterized protein
VVLRSACSAVVTAAVALAVAGSDARIGTAAVRSVGPNGGVDVVAFSPSTDRILVGIEEAPGAQGLWMSDDQGRRWQPVRGIAKERGVTAIAFAPSRPDIAYAGVDWLTPSSLGSGFYVSRDGGASWRRARWSQKIGSSGLPAAMETIVVDPARPEAVYADTHGVLRRSVDGGTSWKRIGGGLPPGVGKPLDRQLVADSAGTLYYATGRTRGASQILRSKNGGASWQPVSSGLPVRPQSVARTPRLAVDPAGPPGVVYAALPDAGLFVTRDGGRRWRRVFGLPTRSIGVSKGTVFFVGGPESGIPALYRLQRSGKPQLLSRPLVDDFAVDPADPTRLYGWSWVEDDDKNVICARLLASRDGGVTWAEIGGQLPLVRQNCARTHAYA